MGTQRAIWVVAVAALAGAGVGCHPTPEPTIPGQTDIAVSSVEIEPRAGEHLAADYGELLENLGLREASKIRPGRPFNPFRLAEDRRRITAFLQSEGHFDAEIDDPELTYAPDHKSVAVVWKVHEGVAYTIGSVDVLGAPAEDTAMLRAMLPFGPGAKVDLETYRPLRRALAERLQDEGYGQARGYCRTFVDRDAKTVAMYFYLDPGPKTVIGTIKVEGNNKVTAEAILARAGLAPGDRYSTTAKRKAELALLDTGAFASAIVITDADIQTGPPEHPDTGGLIAPEQIDANGELVPRKLSDELAVRVVVVEAPQRQLRAEVGIEGDPSRIDAYVGARVTLRNAFGVQHHLVLEGNVGYGWLVDDQDRDPAKGVYGSAQAQYVHPGWLARTLDARITARWRDELYPSAMLREIVAGPGVRSTIATGVFVDFDAFYRFGRQRGMPALDAMTLDALALPAENDSQNLELVASVIADKRNDRAEPTAGWFAGVRSSFSPGGAAGDNRWLAFDLDARGFLPLNAAWSLAGRASAGEVTLVGDEGLPLGPRLFGGGPYGMRGFGRDQLSPVACAMSVDPAVEPDCDVRLGGRSLVEASAELRYLPFRKLYGVTTFVDAGAAGAGTDPTADGVSAALGLGGRIRTWYVPIAVDVSYRLVDHSDLKAPSGLDRWLVFFRIGEAF